MRAETLLLQSPPDAEPFHALTPPLHRASTVLFPTVESFLGRHDRFYDGFSYGLYGHPASHRLAADIAALEAAERALIVPSGMAAVASATLAAVRAGDHVLIPDAVYGPTRSFAAEFLSGFGVAVDFYDPLAGAGVDASMRADTRLVWVESPASYTMEVQDVPAIAAAAHRRGALVAADCSWASPLGFRALDHGADIAVQALSKHVCGHSDVVLGSVATRDDGLYRRAKDALRFLGMGVSPDDCYLVQRGLGTLAARLEKQTASALRIAAALAESPAVARVLFPALAGDPGHALWRRDFAGACGVFSIVLRPGPDRALAEFLENLRFFRLGASWGGLHSLIAPARIAAQRSVRPWRQPGHLIRLSIGLEHPDDLLEDLIGGLGSYQANLAATGS